MEHLLRSNDSAAPPVVNASLPKVCSDKGFTIYKHTYAAAVCAAGLDGTASSVTTHGITLGLKNTRSVNHIVAIMVLGEVTYYRSRWWRQR